jgi:integrase
MNVHLRQRKQSKQGSISLYLEYYKGTAKQPDGTVKVLRDYEYLDLCLIDKPVTPIDKQSNKDTLELAKSIKAKRELEIKNGQYGFSSNKNKNANFITYFDDQAEKRLQSKGNYDNWNSTLKHLKKYKGDQITFNEVTPEFCEQFRNYLRDKAKTKSEKKLSSASVSSYFNKFRACLSQAKKDKIILSNPADDITNSVEIETEREYLTFDEVKKLAKAECRYDVLKRAFLFSCLTGLRWSDIQKMKWSEVKKDDDGDRIVFHQQKTKGLQYLDISEQARAFLGQPDLPDERVFKSLKYSDYFNVALLQWVLRAGITKHITFHCARHTFAVLQLELGTEIYTLSKLLGHSELKTTEIYAKIIDKKKREAVNKIPDINI